METKYLFRDDEYKKDPMSGKPIRPLLFVSIGREIAEFQLSGRQTMGRPAEDGTPDIVIPDHYISRRHGIFITEGTSVRYIADRTTNQTVFRGKTLMDGDTVELLDGDELSVPTVDEFGDSSILIVVATTGLRVDIWRKLMEESKDSRTGLGRRNSFLIWYAQNVMPNSLRNRFMFLIEIDFYEHLREIKGDTAVNKAAILAHCAITEITQITDSIFQLYDSTFVGVLDVPYQSAQRLFEAISDVIINTMIDDMFHITVSITYLDLERAQEKTVYEPEELIDMMQIALEDEKRLNMRNCLVECKV